VTQIYLKLEFPIFSKNPNDYESHFTDAVEGLSMEGIALVNVGLPSS
jgi:hypothetical protein